MSAKNMPRTVKEINTLLNKIRLQTAEILKQKTQIIAILLFDLCVDSFYL